MFKTFKPRITIHNSFFPVVGEKEKSNGTVNVRTRDNKVHGELSVESVIEKFRYLASSKILNSEEFGWSENNKE